MTMQDDMRQVLFILFFLIIPLGVMNVLAWGSVMCRWWQRRLRKDTELS